MALPIDKAADLARDMAKKGISGKISMGEPKDMMGSSGSPMDDAPEKDPALSPDMSAIAGSIMKCIDSGDKAGLAKHLLEIVERCIEGGENHIEPEGEEGASPSEY